MKKFYVLFVFLSVVFFPKVYAISPSINIPTQNTIKSPHVAYSNHKGTVYTQAQIDKLTEGAKNTTIIRTLIKCESQNTNLERMDSNGKMSYGLLQFNGTATWKQFSALADVSGSPLNPPDAIKVADWMISHGELHRWTCAYITGLL